MSGNIEDDLFYDLFGDDGFLTPESTGSTDQDSGHGSPFESNFETSPQQSFGWETTDHVGEFWGSILDDLPSDITDDSDSSDQQPLNFESYKSPLSTEQDEPLLWSTKVMNEGTFDCNSNAMNVDEEWNFHQNPFNSIKDGSLNCVAMDNNNSSYSVIMPAKPELNSSLSNDGLDENEVQLQSTPSIVIKPVTVKKGPAWVVKTSDIKSHFQIGQNIVAIIQNVNTNNLDEKPTPDIHSICNELSKTAQTTCPVIPTDTLGNMISHVKHRDHDYADKDITNIMETTGVSKGMGPGLILTDEEKKLLEMESLKLPEDAPLTKEEEKVLKKVRRKIKNKQSAMESRRKRKEYIENLERRVKHCTDLNHGLRKKVDKLTKDNKSLVSQLKTMKDFIAVSFQQNRAAGTGTCLAVLLLSFALFILPLNPLYFEGKPDNTISAEPPNAMFRSRTLLAIEDNTDYIYHDNELLSYVNESYMYIDSVKVHFDNFGIIEKDYVSKPDISMYMHQNLTWHGLLNDNQTDHYVNS